MRLYLIRHGKPEIKPGICYGSTDIAVSLPEHMRVLSAVTPVLPKHVPVFSSPLRRCSELTAPLAVSLGTLPVIHDDRLAEMHFGQWEMRSWEDIPRGEIDAWTNDLIGYRPGGGESVLQVAQRIRSFHDDLHKRKIESAVIVCHAGTIRLLSECWRDAPLSEMAQHAAQNHNKFAYGELVVLDC